MRAIVAGPARELAGTIHVAHSLFARMKGLLGRKSLDSGEALWIKPCKGIHTIGMRFTIDAVFLDGDNRVVAQIPSLPPNRISPIYRRAASVIELPAGTLAGIGLAIGETIEIL
ncbi:DUF192 domain-containing protein [Oryzomonas sagensis]|uniref:DUF192 domain-containing protein n=1 Tax=Oryzomonas sagensis TaxID=2603857 RepID=A0ABQ6TKG3_9BACT|nr:DUF192 domain-containing protein [Oryzomonas sagensis]KAB0668554.1 DUF192 domain-containing protein [Oryzomonas sagensis]